MTCKNVLEPLNFELKMLLSDELDFELDCLVANQLKVKGLNPLNRALLDQIEQLTSTIIKYISKTKVITIDVSKLSTNLNLVTHPLSWSRR